MKRLDQHQVGRLADLSLRCLLPACTGLLLALALPPFQHVELAWAGLIPLMVATAGCERGEAFRRGYLAGFVFFGMTVWWTCHVTIPGMVGLVAFLALYFGLAGMWFALLMRRWDPPKDSALKHIGISIAMTAGWVTLEWVRGWFLFGGFGWNMIGVTQWRTIPVIQFASVTGVYGVSALVVLVNATLFFTGRRFVRQVRDRQVARRLSWEFYLGVILFAVAFVGGLRVMMSQEQAYRNGSARSLRLAAVQGNIPQSLKMVREAEAPHVLATYRRWTETTFPAKPELIIWPETATPGYLRFDEDCYALVTNLAATSGAYLLTGSMDAQFNGENARADYNAALMIRSDGSLAGLYRKIHLVPFGEYVPVRNVLPFLKWLTPIGESLERGRELTHFQVARLDPASDTFKQATFGVVICFEDTVPELYRRFVSPDVDFMVNITNDGWFQESPAAMLHLANAVFRAVETRRSLVRVTNSGMTCVVDATGRVVTKLPAFMPGCMTFELRMTDDRGTTFYVKHGNVFAWSCAGLTIMLVFALSGKRLNG